MKTNRRRIIPTETKENIIHDYFIEGLRISEIVGKYDVSHTTIYKFVNEKAKVINLIKKGGEKSGI
jgi:transposase-like protein